MTAFPVTDKRRIANIPTTVTANALVAMQTQPPATKAETPEPLPGNRQDMEYSLAPVRRVWSQFLLHHSATAETEAWKAQFKKLLPEVVGQQATALTLDGDRVATFRYDGRFSLSRFKAEQPALYHEFLRRKTVEVFDEDAFREQNPELHELYRGRSLRLTKTTGIDLLAK